MTWRQAMRAALLATAGRGRWWLAALAAFLVRGGLLALLPAIVVIPTPAELAAHLDPSLTGNAPGDVTSVLVELVARVVVVAALVLLVTTAIGGRIEGDLVAAAADDEALEPISRRLWLPLGRAVVARLVAHLPTVVALVLGGLALTDAAYAELVSPSSAASLAVRVAAHAPLAVVAIVIAWLLGEAWGGMAVRHLAAGESLGRALGRGLVGVVRPSGLATLGLSSLAVGLPLVALWLAAARAYDRLWPLIVDRADPWAVVVGLVLFVATWGAGLWLLGIGLAFRSAAWTAEALRTS
jgi:hypothetical protein